MFCFNKQCYNCQNWLLNPRIQKAHQIDTSSLTMVFHYRMARAPQALQHSNGNFCSLFASSVVLHGPGADKSLKKTIFLSTNCPTDHFLFTHQLITSPPYHVCGRDNTVCSSNPFHFLLDSDGKILRVNLTEYRAQVTVKPYYRCPLRVVSEWD